jgi:hypothetical protein
MNALELRDSSTDPLCVGVAVAENPSNLGIEWDAESKRAARRGVHGNLRTLAAEDWLRCSRLRCDGIQASARTASSIASVAFL